MVILLVVVVAVVVTAVVVVLIGEMAMETMKNSIQEIEFSEIQRIQINMLLLQHILLVVEMVQL
jgi:hypothetical protein